MNSEPLYEFVKGKGWVIVNDHVVTTTYGKTWRLELRKPEPGEHCCWTYNKTDLAFWASWVKIQSPYHYSDLAGAIERTGITWCTFILVNS